MQQKNKINAKKQTQKVIKRKKEKQMEAKKCKMNDNNEHYIKKKN